MEPLQPEVAGAFGPLDQYLGYALRRVARNGRANGLHLTDAGRKLLLRARRLHDRHERRVSAILSPLERKRLLTALNRIAGLDEAPATTSRAAARRSASR